VQAVREHHARLAERDGRVLVEITEKAWAAIGVPLKGPATRVLAALMRPNAGGGGAGRAGRGAGEGQGGAARAILAEAEAARRSTRDQIGSELQAHAPQLEEGGGQRALLAPNDDQDARDSPRAEQMMGATRVIGSLPERRHARSQSRTNGSKDVEVNGEVVGWAAAEAAGRKVPDGRVRPLPEQDQAERAKADEERQAERERQPQTSPPGDLYSDPSGWRYR
jgi:hypothetical protein